MVLNGFTFHTGSFGAQTGVHSDKKDINGTPLSAASIIATQVFFISTTDTLSFGPGGGEATISAGSSIQNLHVVFEQARDFVTFKFEGVKPPPARCS